MTIQDSSPERRNLTLTSIAFIAYFFAGGSFTDSTVRLAVINAEFANPEVLCLIVWTIFVWFLYRYWVTHNGLFRREFVEEFNRLQNKDYIRNHYCRVIGQDTVKDGNEGYHVNGVYWQGWCVHIMSVYAVYVERNEHGGIIGTMYPNDGATREKRDIKLSGLKGWLVALRAMVECILKYPSFSSYMVSYILSFLAVSGAVGRYVF